MVILNALKPVFIDGRIVEVGNKFSCSIDYSEKLIEGGSAELVEKEETVKSSPKKAKTQKKKAAESDEL